MILDTALDQVNRRVYSTPAAVRQYARASGWLDAGERIAVLRALTPGASGRVLDVGIGGGRTAPLIAALLPDPSLYVGIDYTPEMVAVATARFPHYKFMLMDARLMRFADASFRTVVFSFNGIDSVGDADRTRILREVWRVLEPGGSFVFSALNRAGRALGEMPWVGDPSWRGLTGVLRRGRRLVQGGVNSLRHRHLCTYRPDTALAPISVHDFGMVVRFTAPKTQVRDLGEVGFIVDTLLDEGGAAVYPDHPGDAAWLYYLARKPLTVDVPAPQATGAVA